MGIVSSLFSSNNQSKSNIQQQRLPPRNLDITTGIGSLFKNKATGRGDTITTSLTPQIADLRSRFTGGIQSLLDSLGGNRGEIVNARVSPLEQQLLPLLARQRRGFANRNVTGSIADNAMFQSASDVGRTLSDARLSALMDVANVERSLFSDFRVAGQDILSQELALLGLGGDAARTATASQLPIGQTGTSTSPNTGSGLGNLLFGIGSIFG